MDEEKASTIGDIGKTLSTWIGIGGAFFGVLSFCVLLGIWFGPLKDMPTQFGAVLTQLGVINARLDKTDGRIDGLQTKYEFMNTQLATAIADQSKLRDDSKRLEILLAQINATISQKIDFLERKAESEFRDSLQSRKDP